MIVSYRSLLWMFVRCATSWAPDTVNPPVSTTQQRFMISPTSSTAFSSYSSGGTIEGFGRLNLTDPNSTAPLPLPDASSTAEPVVVDSPIPTTSSASFTTGSSSSAESEASVVKYASSTFPLLSPGTTPTSQSVISTSIAYIPSDGIGGSPSVTVSITSSDSFGNSSKGISAFITPTSSFPSISASSLSSVFTNSSTKWLNSTSTSSILRTDNSSSSTNRASNWTMATTMSSSPSSATYNNCTSYTSGDPYTIWSIVPNTTTITLTVTLNQTTTYAFQSEYTTPVYCPITTSTTINPLGYAPIPVKSHQSSQTCTDTTSCTNTPPRESSSTTGPFWSVQAATTTFVYITAKNPPIVTTTAQFPIYPDGKTDKAAPSTTDTYEWGPATFPGYNPTVTDIPITTIYNIDGSQIGAITAVLSDGTTVIVNLNDAVIGGQTFALSDQTITEGTDVFTIAPSSVLGPMLVAYVPTLTDPASTEDSGGVFVQTPTPTTIEGVSVGLGPSNVVIGGTSYSIGAGAPQQTVVIKGQTISVGTEGVAFSRTTVQPPPPQPTQYVIIGAEPISAIGSSLAVIDGTTFTYGMGISATSKVENGRTITVGPSGVSYDGTTLGGPLNPTGLQIGILGGVSVTEVCSSLAIVSGHTLTINANAQPSSTIINGETISIGPSGIGIGGQTLTFPFNVPTSTITAGGITFSEVGSSLVVIGSSTFTIGPSVKPTTEVYNGQTISIGPGGVGFKTTTFTAGSAGATATGKKKNGTGRLVGFRPAYGVLGLCIAIGIGYLV